MSVSENVGRIRKEIAEAAIASGRSPEEITLLAATKTQPEPLIREAIAAGVDACGENRVQEMTAKLRAYTGCSLHFIGHLQKNKVKHVVGEALLIHSVDSLSLAGEINRQAEKYGIHQDILLEINIGGEDSKSGFPPDPDQIPLAELCSLVNIRLRGLMCIPPYDVPRERTKGFFLEMRQLLVDIRTIICDNTLVEEFACSRFDTLSMGMSNDYTLAVECGSTLVRVGSGIFGPRVYR